MFHHDKKEFCIKRFTYWDFFILYHAFPVKGFTPNWGVVPESVKKCQTMSKAVND
jgi:hypothetical protein